MELFQEPGQEQPVCFAGAGGASQNKGQLILTKNRVVGLISKRAVVRLGKQLHRLLGRTNQKGSGTPPTRGGAGVGWGAKRESENTNE